MLSSCLSGYTSFFKETRWFLNSKSWNRAVKCTGAGDPYNCIAEETRRAQSQGILYMQFDAPGL